MHSDFLNATALLAALSEVVPALDLKQHLLNPLRERQGPIVFTGEVALRGSEVSALELKGEVHGEFISPSVPATK